MGGGGGVKNFIGARFMPKTEKCPVWAEGGPRSLLFSKRKVVGHPQKWGTE